MTGKSDSFSSLFFSGVLILVWKVTHFDPVFCLGAISGAKKWLVLIRYSIHFDPFCYSEVRIGGKKLLLLIRFSTRFDPIFCSRIKSDQDELQNRIKMSCKIAQFELQLRLMLMRKKYSFWAEIASHLRTLFFDPFFLSKWAEFVFQCI